MELGEALGLSGFGAELFTTVGSTVTSQVIHNLVWNGPAAIWDGFHPETTLNADLSVTTGPSQISGLLASAIGSFLGAKLGAMVVSPTTQAGVALSSIGSAVGAYAAVQIAVAGGAYQLTMLGNFIVPGIGAFVGFVLGALIGNLFGRKKPKTPTASAETALQLPYARYELGTITVNNGGNRDLVTSMAMTARDTLNGLIGMVAYNTSTLYVSNLNGVSTTQIYGHNASQIYVKINGVQSNFASADQAVEFGTLTAIRNTKIVGGDIFAKRVIARSPAADLTSLAGDLQIASDYRFYTNNRDLVNSFITGAYATLTETEQSYYASNKALIDKTQTQGSAALTSGELATYNGNKATIDKIIGALENQALANPWIITLQRVSELGLDKWTTSDFYGGLRGFLDSFDLAAHGNTYESVRISVQGSAAEIQARGQTSDGLFSILPQATAAPSENEVLNARFQENLNGWTTSRTAGVAGYSGLAGGSDWSGNGNDVFAGRLDETPPMGAVTELTSDWMTSAAGVSYETSIQAAEHRGTVKLWIKYYDANKNLISVIQIPGAARPGGGAHGDLANFNLMSGVTVAPPGTLYRQMSVQLISTGEVWPHMFLTQPTSRQYTGGALDWTAEGQTLRISDLAAVGYTVRTGTTGSTGNDLYDQRLTAGSVTINDTQGGDDIFVGGASGDVLTGGAGWDWLDGQAGSDYLDGGADQDVLIGGEGEDTLIGGTGDDYLSGGAGTDNLQGGAGADILADSIGAEVLQGGDGDDKFLIAVDSTFNWFFGGTTTLTSDSSGKDTMSAERLTVGVSIDMDTRASDWTPSHPDPTAANPNSRTVWVLDSVTGAWLTTEGTWSIENATGSNFYDRLYGTAGANVLKGLAGNDQLYGRDGDDVLEGGEGADTLDGGTGNNTASYAGSSAGVYVDLTANELFGGDADGDTLVGIGRVRGSQFADQLKGNSSTNRLEGMGGDDWLVATSGSDTLDGGDGVDFVDYSEATAKVTLNLGAYTATSTTNGSGSSGMASGQTFIKVEGVIGSAFNDNLSAGAGDQTFVGGKGSDTLAGGSGADTYVFNTGDGYDTVNEDATGWNVLSMGEGIKFSDLWIGASGGAGGYLDVGVRGSAGDTIRFVSNFGAYPIAGNNKVKSIELTGAGRIDIGATSYAMAGGETADILDGTSSNSDLIFGYDGADTITGSGTSTETWGNVIVGGKGDDVIHTSTGDDSFGYDRGDGLDVITDDGGEDTIVFGPTVSAEDVIYEIVGFDLFIGAKDADPTLNASQVDNRVKIVNGAVLWQVYYLDKFGEFHFDYEYVNTVEFVIAGGASIDLRKLVVGWVPVRVEQGGWIEPIALDLDGDGLNLSNVESSSVVARTAGGGLSQIAWVGPTDGFLAVDRDGDGAINKLSEISFTQDKLGAKTDLEGLRAWDTNGDGLLDKSDRDFSKILLWVDANQNGRSTKKELRTLEEAGIKAINLVGHATGYTQGMGVESIIYNTIDFVWADGGAGVGYDVSLARRVLGSNGLDAGAYQKEWGAAGDDAELGQLVNDPKAAAKASRIKSKKSLADKITYGEAKAVAQVDFTDHDRVDAAIAKRWKKMDASQKAAWLAGQAEGMEGHANLNKIKALSTAQVQQNALAAAQQASADLVAGGSAQASGGLSVTGPSPASGAASPGSSATPFSAGATAAALSMAVGASEPLDDIVTGSLGQTSQAAWWRTDEGRGDLKAGSLAALLNAMDQGVRGASTDTDSLLSDPSALQAQMLLRQAMAGFGGASGGSAAVWDRNLSQGDSPLAASAGLQAMASPRLVLAP